MLTKSGRLCAVALFTFDPFDRVFGDSQAHFQCCILHTWNTKSSKSNAAQAHKKGKQCDHHRRRRQIICFRLSHLHVTVVAISGFTPIKQYVNFYLC